MGLFNRVPRAEKKEFAPPKGTPKQFGRISGREVKPTHTVYIKPKEPQTRHLRTPIYRNQRSSLFGKRIR